MGFQGCLCGMKFKNMYLLAELGISDRDEILFDLVSVIMIVSDHRSHIL